MDTCTHTHTQDWQIEARRPGDASHLVVPAPELLDCTDPGGKLEKTLLHLKACGGSHGQVNQHRDLVRVSVCVCVPLVHGMCARVCVIVGLVMMSLCPGVCVVWGSVCMHCVPWCRIAWCRVWCGIESCGVAWFSISGGSGSEVVLGRVPEFWWVGFRSSGYEFLWSAGGAPR